MVVDGERAEARELLAQCADVLERQHRAMRLLAGVTGRLASDHPMLTPAARGEVVLMASDIEKNTEVVRATVSLIRKFALGGKDG